MNLKKALLLNSLFFVVNGLIAQNFSGVYKIDQLLKRLENKDTLYVVNFWATWCKPCVKELPSFDSLAIELKGKSAKVLLVSLDFKEELDKKVKPFLKSKGIETECILLDEVNGNDFVDKISTNWTGAIPATLFQHKLSKHFVEKKMNLSEIKSEISRVD